MKNKAIVECDGTYHRMIGRRDLCGVCNKEIADRELTHMAYLPEEVVMGLTYPADWAVTHKECFLSKKEK